MPEKLLDDDLARKELTALQLKREEQKPKAALTKFAREKLMPYGFVIQRHEEHFTHGVPDLSVMGLKKGSWWEMKYAVPDASGRLTFKSKGIQELTMLRLARACIAYYIVFSVNVDGSKHTHIVAPDQLEHWEASPHSARGFNYKFVVEFMWRAHRGEEV